MELGQIVEGCPGAPTHSVRGGKIGFPPFCQANKIPGFVGIKKSKQSNKTLQRLVFLEKATINSMNFLFFSACFTF